MLVWLHSPVAMQHGQNVRRLRLHADCVLAARGESNALARATESVVLVLLWLAIDEVSLNCSSLETTAEAPPGHTLLLLMRVPPRCYHSYRHNEREIDVAHIDDCARSTAAMELCMRCIASEHYAHHDARLCVVVAADHDAWHHNKCAQRTSTTQPHRHTYTYTHTCGSAIDHHRSLLDRSDHSCSHLGEQRRQF